MKRFLLFFLLIILLLSFTGCSKIPGVDTLKDLNGLFADSGDISSIPAEGFSSEEEDIEDDITTAGPETENIVIEPEETETEDGSAFLDLDSQHRINLFLSNFAEAGIEQYPCCNYHKLRFVFSHCQINGVGDPVSANDYIEISRDTAESILNKYIGAVVTEDDDNANHVNCTDFESFISFNGGSYSCPASQVECYAYAAVVDTMQKNDDGTYTVNYRVYKLDPEYSIYDYSSIYKYTPAEALYDWNLSVVYSAEAIVKDFVRSNGQESYQLISLKTT